MRKPAGPTKARGGSMDNQPQEARVDARFVAFLQILGLELPPPWGRGPGPLLYYRGRSRLGELSRMNRKKADRNRL